LSPKWVVGETGECRKPDPRYEGHAHILLYLGEYFFEFWGCEEVVLFKYGFKLQAAGFKFFFLT
jgi:hypothetical protein